MERGQIGSRRVIVAKSFIVRGRVQGVGFRYFAADVAERWGIRGYARNLPNGDVEVYAEGEKGAMFSFKEELQQGPRMARVRELIEDDLTPTNSYSTFVIRG